MRGLPWTANDNATIARMRADGRSDAEIGETLGRTGNAVQAHIHRLKARGEGAAIESHKRRSTWTPENIAEARRLVGEGLTNVQVARRLNTTPSYVSKMLAHVGVPIVCSPPGEPVQVSKVRLDPRQVVRELDNARASLARAEHRYAAMMAPVHIAIRAAMQDCADPQGDIAEYLCTALRERGFMIVEASRA